MSLLDPAIFASLDSKIEEEALIRDSLGQIVQKLDRVVSSAQGLLSRVHSTPKTRCTHLRSRHCVAANAPDAALVKQVEASIAEQVTLTAELAELASKHPYYK